MKRLKELKMPVSSCEPSDADLTSNKNWSFLLWKLPTIVFVIGFLTNSLLRTILWTVSLTVMGIACLNNARKCGRIHCYFTGPFFLLAALASLIYGLGITKLHFGYGVLGFSIAAGAYFFRYVPEMIWGKYKP